ncbi:MAG: peptidoglycan DD-metalloendopeptidase family protein [Clostridiales bacterium]|nr:peptidoglycan DD-metalloendopeptidase family protein [Clostridiales bacterium]MDY4059997.1 peptidoglycan DD-metalloendopeptidase family protein [Anaerovoracaceae bacterium]
MENLAKASENLKGKMRKEKLSMSKSRGLLSKIAVLFMCTIMVAGLGFSSSLLNASYGVSTEDKQKELNQVNEKKEKAQKEEKDVMERIKTKAKELQDAEAALSQQKAKIDNTHAQVEQKKIEVNEKKQQLEVRLRAIYKKGSAGFIEVILNSKNVSELISNITFMQRIYKGDKDAITSVKKEEAELTAMIGQLKDEEKNLVAKKEAAESAKASLEKDKEQIQGQLNQLEADSNNISAEIAKAQQEAAARRAAAEAASVSTGSTGSGSSGGSGGSSSGSDSGYVVGTGALGWPCRGPVTSEFGYRPEFGRMHEGIDIGVPTGTPIHAADSGVVIISSWYGGYGYAVVIDHGNGISTTYGHNSSLAVSAGQSVSKGQVIAYAGNTGFSFGSHCHFEVRINGTPVNPRGYL